MAKPTAKFFEAQTPPDLPLLSIDNLDWYVEQKKRCFDGFSFRGDRFTGDQWWYYNFNPMSVAILDKNGKATKHFDIKFPYWSQEDDYLFKQIEEADQDNLGVMLMSGRGFGKTYLVLSIGTKYFYLTKESHGVISASGKDHADETWKKFRGGVSAINRIHPTLALDLLTDNDTHIESGDEVQTNGRWDVVSRSLMEKIIYDKKPGKSKGRRLNFQHFEECLGKGTKVLMHNRTFKNVEDITIGDLVMGIDSLPKEVMNTNSGIDQLYLVNQDKGVDYVVNSKHKLVLEQKCQGDFYRDNGIKVYTVDELTNLNSHKRKNTYGIKNDGLNTQIKVSSIGQGEYFGFTLGGKTEQDHWFLLEDSTISHNCGDWGGAASLKECIAASEGSWKVGGIKKCREFYTGTGGTILSDQAKEIFYNPDAYGLYKVKQYADRPTAIFIPAPKKFGGYWEKDGISDEAGALAEIERIRLLKLTDPDPTAYNKYIQEFPLTLTEMFMKKGGNRFNQKTLCKNITILEVDPSKRKGEWGNVHWKKKDGEIIGVEWEQSNNGKIWRLEPPVINEEHGIVEPRLYVGGYDGIDVGVEDTASGLGSQGALSIKKRLLPGAGTSNIYVCHYFERPQVIEDFFDTCLMIAWMFGAKINIEDSKRGIVGHAKKLKMLNFFMKRPRLTLQNIETENESTLIGTTPTEKNFQYGETFLAQHIKDYGDQIHCFPVLEFLRDFSMSERGKFDVPVSMMMAEIADDEYMDKPVGVQKQTFSLEEEYGYYTDNKGKKRFGLIPKVLRTQFNFQNPQSIDYLSKERKLIYLNN